MSILESYSSPEDLEAYLVNALANSTQGVPVNEDEVADVVGILTAAHMIKMGMDEADVRRQFDERDWAAELNYNREADEFSYGVRWLDGDEAEVTTVISETSWADEHDGNHDDDWDFE